MSEPMELSSWEKKTEWTAPERAPAFEQWVEEKPITRESGEQGRGRRGEPAVLEGEAAKA